MQVNTLKDRIELIPEGELEEIYLDWFGLKKPGDAILFIREDEADHFVLVAYDKKDSS